MTELILRQSAMVWSRIKPRDGAIATIVIILALILILDPARMGYLVVSAVESLVSTLPYIAAAVLMIGWLKAAGAEAMIARAFEGREVQMIFLAALIGGLAPFCSCQVIPFIAGLLALGAPLSAIMAFWLASPLIDPPTLVITAKALGWTFAIGKAVAAISIGLLGGFAILALNRVGVFTDPLKPRESKGCGTSCCSKTPDREERVHWRIWTDADRRRTFAEQIAENAFFLIKWLSLAYLLEALLVTYVPAEMVAGLVGGNGLDAIILGALVGAPAYLNSYVAPPLVAGLMAQGMGSGAAMAFMVAGAVSCIPAMAAVWSLVKPPVFAAYVGLGLGGAILFGLLYQTVIG